MAKYNIFHNNWGRLVCKQADSRLGLLPNLSGQKIHEPANHQSNNGDDDDESGGNGDEGGCDDAGRVIGGDVFFG